MLTACSLLESGSQTPRRCGDQQSSPKTTSPETLSYIYSWRMSRWAYQSFFTYTLFCNRLGSSLLIQHGYEGKTRHTFDQVRWFKSFEDCSSQHWVKFEAELSQTGWKKWMGVEFLFQHISAPIAVPSIFFTGVTFNWCAVTRPKTSICSLACGIHEVNVL